MLRIYICPNCYNLRMVSRRPDAICLHCGNPLICCDVNYESFMNMSEDDRTQLKNSFKARMLAYNEKQKNSGLN